MNRIALVIILPSVLAGCAGMSKDECLMADWRLIGFEDGANGYSRTQIAEHRKVCASHGVAPDKAEYDLGYDEGILTFCSYARGLRSAQYGESVADVCPRHSEYHDGYAAGLESYCTYDRGLEEGLAGNAYDRICPSGAEPDFLGGYNEGYHVFDLRSRRAQLLYQLGQLGAESGERLDQIEEIVSDVAFDGDLTPQQRTEKLLQADDLRKQNKAAGEEGADLGREVEQITAELAELGYE